MKKKMEVCVKHRSKRYPQETECRVYEIQIFITEEPALYRHPYMMETWLNITDSFLRPRRIKTHTFSRSPLCEKRLRSA